MNSPVAVRAVSYLPPDGVRLCVEFTDGTALTLYAFQLDECPLHAGDEVDGETLERLTEASRVAEALSKGLNALDRRDYSVNGLVRKLRQKGFTKEQAEQAAGILESRRLLNDERFAQQALRHYGETKGFGESRVRNEMYRLGLQREDIDRAMEGFEANEGALQAFLERRLRGKNDPDTVRKAVAAALRRGFDYEQIKNALRRIKEDIYEEEFTD